SKLYANGEDRVRSRGTKVLLRSRSVNRENFPNGVTDLGGEPDRVQIALNSSNGSPHARHTRSDLHAVDPNSLVSTVFRDPQRGHVTARSRLTSCSTAVCPADPGGAIP